MLFANRMFIDHTIILILWAPCTDAHAYPNILLSNMSYSSFFFIGESDINILKYDYLHVICNLYVGNLVFK